MDLPIKAEIVEIAEPSTVEKQQRLSELEGKIQSAFYEAGLAFREIRDKHLYRVQGYTKFKTYVKEKWGKSNNHAYDLISTAKIISEDLLPISNEKVPLPTAESQVRPLKNIEPIRRQQVWLKACETAPNGKITEEHVKKVKNELFPSSERSSESTIYTLHEQTHTEIQWMLAKLGSQLCDRVWIASNDHSKLWENEAFNDLSIDALPSLGLGERAEKAIKYIDVLWLDSDNHIEAAFEIECTTQIYSGLLRMLDLVTLHPNITIPLYIVVPKARVEQVKAELLRPAFNNKRLKLHHKCRWIIIEELVKKWDRMMELCTGSETINKIAHSLDDE
jgi:hypothetical protein